jgi:hypothetical protein
MKRELNSVTPMLLFSTRRAVLALTALLPLCAVAQNPDLQEKVTEIKQAAAANKRSLAQYTWQEQQTISIKGEVKKQDVYQVRLGPDGKPVKTELGGTPSAEPSGGRLKQHMVEKKKEEYEDYAHQIAELAQSYARPDPQRLQQAYQQGDVTFGSAGAPGELKVVITNYIKPNDSVTIIFNRREKAIQSLNISSYPDDPKDVVTMSAQFSKLPDGTNHVSGMTVNGESKHLTVQTQNSNYQKAIAVVGSHGSLPQQGLQHSW